MLIGNRLKELRELHNISQKELGQAIGVSDTMISMYEQNRKNPSLQTILKMAEYFSVSVDYLTGINVIIEDEIPENIRAVARDLMELPEENRKLAIDMIKMMSERGKEAKKK